jgi:hypothetical protein
MAFRISRARKLSGIAIPTSHLLLTEIPRRQRFLSLCTHTFLSDSRRHLVTSARRPADPQAFSQDFKIHLLESKTEDKMSIYYIQRKFTAFPSKSLIGIVLTGSMGEYSLVLLGLKLAYLWIWKS